VRRSSGEVLPACLGLEFELADFELQPLPPRYAIAAARTEPIDGATEVIDLVGASPRLPAIEYAPNNGRAPSIAQQARRHPDRERRWQVIVRWKLPSYLRQNQVRVFFSVITSLRDKALFTTIYLYGLRVSEACLLRRSKPHPT
jgi:integrase